MKLAFLWDQKILLTTEGTEHTEGETRKRAKNGQSIENFEPSLLKCAIRDPWTRQIATIEMASNDAITDDGQETWNLLASRGIENVILCGVHLNMCVLGRPFAIRQMSALGKKVALMRDMTDTMYNPERPPGVSHFEGTKLMIGHVEKYWCPTFTSSDITAGPEFRFRSR